MAKTTATVVAQPAPDEPTIEGSNQQIDPRDAHIAKLEAELAALKTSPSTQSNEKGRKTQPGHRWVTPRFDHDKRYGERTYVFKADQPVQLPNEVADWVTGTHGGVRSSAFYI